jgi:hypothetical protein
MSRRPALALLLVAGLSLTVVACGGSSSNATSTSSSNASASGNGDAQVVLASIRTNVGEQGPQKISLAFTATISGSPKDPTLGAFLTKPISITLDGPVDTKAKKSDLTFELSAGPIKVDGGLRQVGDASFLQINGKWYSLPAGALSSTSGSTGSTTTTSSSSVDPQALLQAFGDPKALFANATLAGTEDVGGVKSDHVTGDVDLAALVKGVAAVAKDAGSGTSASPVSPAQVAQGVQSLQQYVKSASADLWVGQDDKQIHRFATTIDGTTDAATKASSGIDGFKITLDLSATPTSTPSVSAPSSPAPIAQLQQDLGGLLGGLAAAGGTTTG